MLLGEYAVLEGAPALVMAVNRRAHVVIQDGAPNDYYVSAPQLGLHRVTFRIGDGGAIRWEIEDTQSWQRFALTAKLLEALLADYRDVLDERNGFNLVVDTGELFQAPDDGGLVKLGLGSSAAVCAALAAAVKSYFGAVEAGPETETDMTRLLSLYRASQGGYGSGADLAVSLYGGVLSYRIDGTGTKPVVSGISLPRAVCLLFVWSGTAAATVSLLERFSRWRRSHSRTAGDLMAKMQSVAEFGIRGAATGDAPALLAAIHDYVQLMDRLGKAIGAEIMSPAHCKIAEAAARLGVAYKPCGAGGGDIGVALSEDAEILRVLEGRLAQAGFHALSIKPEPKGVRTSSTC